ncbi:major capsid protein (plasmid) [Kitasatospora sp. NBC_01246]|uniref:major capsid protein n=1 Tax=Kitasatospora sp. NBC_01246 TaxID=2903570 RepID=UPI002E2F531D|nr:major capsid protein [Kitasatospora sp. NBC_01246]
MPNEMLDNLLKGIDATEIHAFVRSIKTRADFELTNSIVPVRTIDSVKWKTKRSTRRVLPAKYRAWDSSAPVAAREIARFETEGQLPPLSQKYILGELETILLNASRGLDNQDVIDDIYRDVASHVLAIQQRMEIAAGDVLADGKLTLNGENGLTVEVDYQVPSANRPVASVPWTDPNADMLRDEMLWIEYLRSIGAPLPTRALTSYKAAALMAGNSSYRNAFYNPQGVNIPSAVLAPDQVQAVRARYGLPPITIYDLQLPAEAGGNVRVLPENMYFLLPPDSREWAETQYGLTAEGLVLSNGGNPAILREEAPGIIVTHGYSDDPAQLWTKGSASAMPVMYVPDIYVAATVW